jgi:hypothetical protein
METTCWSGAAAGEITVSAGPGGIGLDNFERGDKYFSGAASNFRAHPVQQKK